MNLFSFRRLATQVLVVAVALAAVLTSGAPAQSLGDVARQEEARRKGTTTGAGKVYTNGDLRGAPAPAATSSQPSPSSPSTAAPATPDVKDAAKPADPNAKAADGKAKAADGAAPKADAKTAPDAKGDEASWRKRRQTIQEAIDRDKTFAEALQSRINGLSADFSARDDPAQRTLVANDRQKALTELDRVKKEIVQHTKELSDLQEEARKSGVPAGWLR
jgi:hypothetical protein